MIHKLRLKFIRIAMAALMAAVILIAAAINVMNWLNVRSEIGETISFLAEKTSYSGIKFSIIKHHGGIQ